MIRCAYLLWIAISHEVRKLEIEQPSENSEKIIANTTDVENKLTEVKQVASELKIEGRREGNPELVEEGKILDNVAEAKKEVEQVEETALESETELSNVENENKNENENGLVQALPADPIEDGASSAGGHHWFLPLVLVTLVGGSALFVVQKRRRDQACAEKNIGQDLSIYYSDGYQVLL